MDFEKLTDRARGFLQAAQTIAVRMNHQRIAPAHVLKALLEDEQGMAAGADRARRRQTPRRRSARPTRRSREDPSSHRQRRQRRPRLSTARPSGCSTRPSRSRRRPATATSRSSGSCSRWPLPRTTTPARRWPKAGVNAESAQRRDQRSSAAAAARTRRAPRTATTRSRNIARDLTQAARDGKLDPVIGRDEEIRRTIQILARRTKNNPVLIGEPGVGKTAIAEGLALANRQWRRARQPQGQAADGARHGQPDRRRQISRRVRRAAEGRARRGQARPRATSSCSSTRCTRSIGAGKAEGAMDASQPAEAGARTRRASLHRRDHARRISQAYREGRGAAAALPTGLRRRADRSRTRSRSCAGLRRNTSFTMA